MDIQTTGNFLSCDSLLELQENHNMNMAWSMPPLSSGYYSKIEIQRIIGNKGISIDIQNIDYSGYPIIYSAQQNLSGAQIINSVSAISFFPDTSYQTLNTTLSCITSYNDSYDIPENSFNLSLFQTLDVAGNDSIITDICNTERVLYYILNVYITT